MKASKLLAALLVLPGAVFIACGDEEVGPEPEESEVLGPIENFKHQRFIAAIRGLDYGDRVTTNQYADDVVPPDYPLTADEQLAEAAYLLGDNAYVEAIGAHTRAVILAPSNPDAYVGLAKSLRTKGEMDMALAALRTALDLEPQRLEARFALAEMLWQNDEWSASQRELEAVVMVPTLDENEIQYQVHAWQMLASAYWYSNDYERALQAAHRCEELGGEVPPQLVEMIREKLAGGVN